MLSEFQSGLSNLKHYNETISRALVATCQVLPVKKTDQWGVSNKEPICEHLQLAYMLWGDM